MRITIRNCDDCPGDHDGKCWFTPRTRCEYNGIPEGCPRPALLFTTSLIDEEARCDEAAKAWESAVVKCAGCGARYEKAHAYDTTPRCPQCGGGWYVPVV